MLISIKDFFKYELIIGIKNIFFFWKNIWNYRSWDYSFQLKLFAKSLEPLANTLEKNGTEVSITRLKKVKQIRRAIEILNNQADDKYFELAEKTLKYSANIEDYNNKIFELSNSLSNDEWDELFKILKGQSHSEFIMFCDKSKLEHTDIRDLWNHWYDGSGIHHWWD